LSQLNLGYITRVNNVEGRKDFRGEGFELRTDGWGVIRAAKGMYISTDARSQAEEHHKDLREAQKNLEIAATQQANHSELAEVHNARDYGSEVKPLIQSLKQQVHQVRGTGVVHKELTDPHLIISSPAGIALTTPENTHIHGGENVALTAERQVAVSTGRGFMVTALKKISLFAHKLGIKIFAASGKVEIQSQSDDLEIIADKILKIISAKAKVHISSPKEILLTAGGSFLKIDAAGVESGTQGEFIAHAGRHNFVGPETKDPLLVTWQKGEPKLTPRIISRDELGRSLDIDRYAKSGSGEISGDVSEHELKLFDEHGLESKVEESFIRGCRELIVDGNKVQLTKKRSIKEDD
jgi:type VI secretion system secreted protein VgrG